MGKVSDDEEEEKKETTTKFKKINQTAWTDWWQTKQVQNDKLRDAIIDNNHTKVKTLLYD